MNIFGKRIRGRGGRKSLFLCTTALRGFLAKDENDGTEVGPGFAEAAAKMGSDDNREPTQKSGATQEVPDDTEGNAEGGTPNENGGDGESNPDGQDDGEDGEPKPKPKKDRNTAEYVRNLKRENRELKRGISTVEQRLAALENGGLPKPAAGGSSADTSEAPDADDAKKYPLGVLDDGFIRDSIKYEAKRIVAETLDGQRRADTAKTEQGEAQTRMTELREKMDTLTDKGAEQFDDFEELVVEGGLRGDWKLTETTFTAAADADNGPAILFALANDKDEALRVSKLTPFQQLKYVAEKDGEITAAKPKPKTKPGAGTPPDSAPRGRNGSSPIRADTDNLDDFRKLYYAK